MLTCLMHWSSWLPLVLYISTCLTTCTFIICVPFYIQFMFFLLRQISSKLNLLSRFQRRRVKLVFRASLHWTCYNANTYLNCVVSNAKRHWTQAVSWDGMQEYKRESLNTIRYYDFVMVLQWFLVYVICAILHCTHKHINGTI